MFAIFKRELRSYFTSLVGYVVIGVMLAFIGLYYSANCLVYGTSDFSTVLYSTTLVMLFLLPALTMRSFADERRNKTDQLLLTSPVGIPSIVMGKYFAQLAVFAVPMAAAAIMPLVLTAFGTISLTSAYATWLAYFLMGAACIAIGTFVSALTENQIIAYLATFGALLICGCIPSSSAPPPPNGSRYSFGFGGNTCQRWGISFSLLPIHGINGLAMSATSVRRFRKALHGLL